MNKWFWTQIWNLSEFTNISLGKYAPFVFGKMIGAKGVEVDSLGKNLN
jgi:hypothetical protein